LRGRNRHLTLGGVVADLLNTEDLKRWLSLPSTASLPTPRWPVVLAVPASCLLAFAFFLCVATPALAAEAPAAAHSEATLIVQIVLLIATGRLLGEIMQRVGQPSVTGQLLAGILLGPSVLGLLPSLQHALFPDSERQQAMLEGIAQFGIILLLLL